MWKFRAEYVAGGSFHVLAQALLSAGLGLLLIFSGDGCSRNDYTASMHHNRTSVLWLTLCTLRADHLGAYGYERAVSPFIDSLAHKGVVFDRAMAPASWTRASVASSATGFYPRTLDIDEPSSGSNDRQLLDSFQTMAEVLHEAGYYTIGITANPNTHSVFNFDQGYDYYEDTGRFLWRSGYSDKKLTAKDVDNALLGQLRKLPSEKKFFAHLTYIDVHTPLLNYGHAGRFQKSATFLTEGYIAHYDGEIRSLDSAIGGLLHQIDIMGFKDLLVIVTSDHGEAFGHLHEGDVYHGHTLYNETIWVPFIIYHPSLERVKGRRSQRIDLASIMPTVLDLLGLKDDLPPTGAKSLKNVIFDESAKEPTSTVVSETCFGDANRSAVLYGDWKLIATYKPDTVRISEPYADRYELYNLVRDWHEAHDLAANQPEQVKKLALLLGNWQDANRPKAEHEGLDVRVPPQLLERLRTLGYVK
jgi:choline-sulfatase